MSFPSTTGKNPHNKGKPVILITDIVGFCCYKICGRVK
jgi:hypothetical protein